MVQQFLYVHPSLTSESKTLLKNNALSDVQVLIRNKLDLTTIVKDSSETSLQIGLIWHNSSKRKRVPFHLLPLPETKTTKGTARQFWQRFMDQVTKDPWESIDVFLITCEGLNLYSTFGDLLPQYPTIHIHLSIDQTGPHPANWIMEKSYHKDDEQSTQLNAWDTFLTQDNKIEFTEILTQSGEGSYNTNSLIVYDPTTTQEVEITGQGTQFITLPEGTTKVENLTITYSGDVYIFPTGGIFGTCNKQNDLTFENVNIIPKPDTNSTLHLSGGGNGLLFGTTIGDIQITNCEFRLTAMQRSFGGALVGLCFPKKFGDLLEVTDVFGWVPPPVDTIEPSFHNNDIFDHQKCTMNFKGLKAGTIDISGFISSYEGDYLTILKNGVSLGDQDYGEYKEVSKNVDIVKDDTLQIVFEKDEYYSWYYDMVCIQISSTPTSMIWANYPEIHVNAETSIHIDTVGGYWQHPVTIPVTQANMNGSWKVNNRSSTVTKNLHLVPNDYIPSAHDGNDNILYTYNPEERFIFGFMESGEAEDFMDNDFMFVPQNLIKAWTIPADYHFCSANYSSVHDSNTIALFVDLEFSWEMQQSAVVPHNLALSPVAAISGDPYLFPVSGPAIKLPDTYGIYRTVQHSESCACANIVVSKITNLDMKDAPRMGQDIHVLEEGYFITRLVIHKEDKAVIDIDLENPFEDTTISWMPVELTTNLPATLQTIGRPIIDGEYMSRWLDMGSLGLVQIRKYKNPQIRTALIWVLGPQTEGLVCRNYRCKFFQLSSIDDTSRCLLPVNKRVTCNKTIVKPNEVRDSVLFPKLHNLLFAQ